jgi:glycosyltransferase involved in cell wall biosynthesis
MLHVFPSFAYGGQQARLATLARGLGPAFRHLVLSLDEDISARALFDEDAPVEFNTYKMEKSRGFSLTNIFTFRKLLHTTVPDILCTYNWGSIEAAIANRMGARAPHIHFEDGFGADETDGRANRKRDISRRLILSKSVVVVPSHGLKQAATVRWKLKPDQVRLIKNAVDGGRLQSGEKPAGRGVVVGSLGALRKEKNYGRLIKAFISADRDKNARLEIIGDGPERGVLGSLAGNDERIALPGATASPGDAYARFDIFALSSNTEQAPISLMEAMATGLPVVATNVGDIADMVSEENLPYITPPGNDAAYAEALAQMLQNPSARAVIGAANRRKAKDAFSLERMVDAHRTLYLESAGRI